MMNTLPIIEERVSLYVNREETNENSTKKVVNFHPTPLEYGNMLLPEKWKYRKAVNDLQLLINKIQREELTNIEDLDFELPEVVTLLKIRKQMLTAK
jgi:hypothetical protein